MAARRVIRSSVARAEFKNLDHPCVLLLQVLFRAARSRQKCRTEHGTGEAEERGRSAEIVGDQPGSGRAQGRADADGEADDAE
jgi:hypothetical protein